MTTDTGHAMTETDWTATGVSAAVRTGAATAVEMTQEALRRIESRDGEVGAVRRVRTEAALAEAAAVDARPDRDRLPLAGVPVLIKDNIPVAGEAMRLGSLATADLPQAVDHPVVTRLREAGAVVVGISRMPELGLWALTDGPEAVTRNPWNQMHTPGGSSGGAAAAVAAGLVPIAHGNDGLGSIRGPAACCGLVGLKPGSGVVPAEIGDTDWYGMAENGALTTTVADAALALAVLSGQPEFADIPDMPERLRVAVSVKNPVGSAVTRDAVKTTFEVAGMLIRAGFHVDRDDPPAPPAAALTAMARWFVAAADDAESVTRPGELQARTRRHASIGAALRKTPLVGDKLREPFVRTAGEFLHDFDLLLTPALATEPPLALNWWDDSWLKTFRSNLAYAPFQGSWNLAGFPAIVVPAGRSAVTGLPWCVQLVAAPGRESLLLSVAAWLEHKNPWPRTAE